ncbi:MAG: UDP-glucose 4-epimerase GalE [Chlamydiia bacterium]|nr:UDP-glucose 4-epimerase GalE [Chlamydiia bacterium]
MILITGGAGFIGSNTNRCLNALGYRTLVFDNFSKGSKKAVENTPFIEGDLRDRKQLKSLFENHDIQAVMHFAALTDVGESCTNPQLYFDVNAEGSLNLLEAMIASGVKQIIFSSTAAVYGHPEKQPIKETDTISPINPYGQSKWEVEKMLKELSDKKVITATSFRYFNAAGGDPEGRQKNYKNEENNLIPLILRAIKNNTPLSVYGDDWPTSDGTCVRDYIHVEDLALAHILALKERASDTYNLGNGSGFSVKEVIQAAENALNRPIKWKAGPKRAGDPPVLVADSTKAQEKLKWKPKFPGLEKMILDAWRALP